MAHLGGRPTPGIANRKATEKLDPAKQKGGPTICVDPPGK
jgi:hypothetical protein